MTLLRGIGHRAENSQKERKVEFEPRPSPWQGDTAPPSHFRSIRWLQIS